MGPKMFDGKRGNIIKSPHFQWHCVGIKYWPYDLLFKVIKKKIKNKKSCMIKFAGKSKIGSGRFNKKNKLDYQLAGHKQTISIFTQPITRPHVREQEENNLLFKTVTAKYTRFMVNNHLNIRPKTRNFHLGIVYVLVASSITSGILCLILVPTMYKRC